MMNILRNTLTFTVGFQALYTLELYTSVGVPVGWPWHYVKITRASESKTASCMIFSSKVLIQSSMIVTYMGTITQFFLCVIGMYLKTADDLAKTYWLSERIFIWNLWNFTWWQLLKSFPFLYQFWWPWSNFKVTVVSES